MLYSIINLYVRVRSFSLAKDIITCHKIDIKKSKDKSLRKEIKMDHRTRQFLMCWLRVYAWLRVKNKVKGTSVRIGMWCKLDHRTRQFLMCWLRVYAWLRVKIKVKNTGVRIVLWCGLDHGTRQFLMC